jgi:hypothetical protein
MWASCGCWSEYVSAKFSGLSASGLALELCGESELTPDPSEAGFSGVNSGVDVCCDQHEKYFLSSCTSIADIKGDGGRERERERERVGLLC